MVENYVLITLTYGIAVYAAYRLGKYKGTDSMADYLVRLMVENGATINDVKRFLKKPTKVS